MGRMDDLDLSAWDEEEQPSALRLFTDREDPQEAFERKLNYLQSRWQRSFCVLAYYGIGGIGKTTLCTRLCHILGEDAAALRMTEGNLSADYVSFDFREDGISNDKRSVLTSLRNQIMTREMGFHFYLFDTALVRYCRLAGVDYRNDSTISSIVDGNRWLDAAIDALGLLPGVGIGATLFKAFDTAIAAGRELMINSAAKRKYREEFIRIGCMEKNEIMDALQEFFILDMRGNMQNEAKRPLVIFVDTYEKYVDPLSNQNATVTGDHWLYNGRKSVIRSIPGIMWVIFGREKLKWEEYDPVWKPDRPSRVPEPAMAELTEQEKEDLAAEVLEQHCLGNLSDKDSLEFLERAGVRDPRVRAEIYRLTHGTPIFLDICARRCERLAEEGREPAPGDFGRNLEELVDRYLADMPSEYRELSSFLAIIGTWEEDLAFQTAALVAERSRMRPLTGKMYREYLSHSFVIKLPNGKCYLHETVQKACVENASEELVSETGRALRSIYRERLADRDSLQFGYDLERYADVLFTGTCYEEALENWPFIRSCIAVLAEKGDYQRCHAVSKMFRERAEETFPCSGLCLLARVGYARSLVGIGEVREAFSLVERDGDAQPPEDIPAADFYSRLAIIGSIYEEMGRYRESLAISRRALEGLSRVEEHSSRGCLRIMAGIGEVLIRLGDRKEALRVIEQVHDIQVRKMGEKHRDALYSLSLLGRIRSDSKEPEKALEICREVYRLNLEKNGENHPDTIRALRELGDVFAKMGAYEKAVESQEKAYRQFHDLLGENHPDTVSAMNSLGDAYSGSGKYNEALDIQKKAYDIRRDRLGDAHPDTIASLMGLETDYSKLGRSREAEDIASLLKGLKKEEIDTSVPTEQLHFNELLHTSVENFLNNDQEDKVVPKGNETEKDFLKDSGKEPVKNSVPDRKQAGQEAGAAGNNTLQPEETERFGKEAEPESLAEDYFASAKDALEAALAQQIERYGEGHASSRKTMMALGDISLRMQAYGEAVSYYERVDRIRRNGPEDSGAGDETLPVLIKLSRAYRAAGMEEAYLETERRIGRIRQDRYGGNSITVAKEDIQKDLWDVKDPK